MPPKSRAKGKAKRPSSSSSSTRTGASAYGAASPFAFSRAARKPSGPPSKLATLPLALFHHMLPFVVSDVRPTPERPLSVARLDLQGVAMVSTAWRTHAAELASQLTLGKSIVHIKKGTRRELLDVRYKLTLRRPFLRELWLAITPPSIYVNEESTKWHDRLSRFLQASMSCAPRLELLDLRNYCGASEHVAMIVTGAAKFCPQLQALILSADMAEADQRQRMDGRKITSVDLLPMHDAVLHGLQQWHHHGSSGGLRQLRLPSRPATNRFANSVIFLQKISMHCPNIELLDANVWMGAGTNVSRDQYIVDRKTWTLFCSTFQLDPRAVRDRVLRNFRQLQEATAHGTLADRVTALGLGQYYEDVGEEEAAAVRAAGVGKAATRIQLLLRGCPALEKLTIWLHSPAPGPANAQQNIFAQLGIPNVPVDPLTAATKNSMDDEQFGDDFMDALATHCPYVKEITLVQDDAVNEFFATRSHPILSFADRALRRLGSLRFLKILETRTINASGKGLFELVNSPVNEAPGQREFSVALGDDAGSSEMAFYRALEGFLRCLHQHEGPLNFTTKKLVLHLANSKMTPETRRWSETYLTRLKHGMKEVRAKFPTLQFRIEAGGLTKTSFARLSSFGMFTATAKPMAEHGWTNVPRGALVDGVFMKQELCMQDYGYSGPIPDYDEDYDYGYGGFEGGGGARRGGGGRDGYYGDYENERGFYGMGGYDFFNGLQLDDSFHDDEDEYYEDY